MKFGQGGGRAGPGQLGGAGGPRAAPPPRRGPRSPPGPATSAAHGAAIKGKRPQVAQPNLVIRPAGRRAARGSFLPELPVFRGARGGGPRCGLGLSKRLGSAAGGLARGRPRLALSSRSCGSARRLRETPAREARAAAQINLSQGPSVQCESLRAKPPCRRPRSRDRSRVWDGMQRKGRTSSPCYSGGRCVNPRGTPRAVCFRLHVQAKLTRREGSQDGGCPKKTKLKETRKDDDQVWEYVVVLSVLFRVFEILHELFTMEGGKKHNGVESDIVVSLFDPQLLLLYNGAINNPFGESLLRIICSDVCKVLSMSPRYIVGAPQRGLYGASPFP
ncbi:uncharacterized protein LOC118525342 [Halichoerus grypus]